MKKTLLFVISIFINVMSYAYDFKDGDCYYTITSLSDQTVALTNSGEILIDYGVDYLPVYSPCYGGDFVVPTTAKYVGKEFTVTSIENSAFDKCKFSKLVIPENILSANLRANSDLEIDQLIIEDSETPLKDCSAEAKEVYIGRNISNSYTNSFYNVEKVTFGDNVTYLYEGEFQNCPFTEVSLGKNITKIYYRAFGYCENLKTVRGAGVESVGSYAFSGCTSLESFDFPNLMSIDNGAFDGCTSLKNVILSETVTEIDERAFSHCTSLEEIYISGTIESLGDGLFAGCDNLKKISVAAKNPVNIKLVESAFDTQTYINATLYVPAGSKEKYSNTAVWNNFFNIQEDASLVSTMGIVYVDFNDYYGKVEYQGKQISFGEKIKVKIGEPFTLSFIPKDGFSLSEVTVNGDDWTNMVKNNQLTIPSVEGKIDLYADFDELPVYLTIKQAENGSVKVKTYMGERYQFVIEPAIGWSIHSVTFNGEDVTSQVGETGEYKTPKINENSELIVAFEENTDGIAYQCQSKAKVSASSGTIMVRDAASTEQISIYNDSGMLIENVKGNGSLQTFSVPASQMYIVKVGDRTVKIGL